LPRIQHNFNATCKMKNIDYIVWHFHADFHWWTGCNIKLQWLYKETRLGCINMEVSLYHSKMLISNRHKVADTI
jgi:hypothetical protein